MVSALDNISRARARKFIASARSLISAIAKLAVFAGKTCTLGLALTGDTTREPGSGLSGQMPPRAARCRRGRASGASYAPSISAAWAARNVAAEQGGEHHVAIGMCMPAGANLSGDAVLGAGIASYGSVSHATPWAKGSLGLDHATQSLATICAYTWRHAAVLSFSNLSGDASRNILLTSWLTNHQWPLAHAANRQLSGVRRSSC
jgi:hypothetical protein